MDDSWGRQRGRIWLDRWVKLCSRENASVVSSEKILENASLPGSHRWTITSPPTAPCAPTILIPSSTSSCPTFQATDLPRPRRCCAALHKHLHQFSISVSHWSTAAHVSNQLLTGFLQSQRLKYGRTVGPQVKNSFEKWGEDDVIFPHAAAIHSVIYCVHQARNWKNG